MKEISWANIINGYKDYITSHNLRTKIEKQLQEEYIGSYWTCNLTKGQSLIAFSTFFTIVNQYLLVQSYIARTVVLLKQVLVIIKKKECLSGETVEIINEFLTTFVYRIPLGLSEQGVGIFIKTLIQKTNRFDQVPISDKIEELVSVYTILPDEKDLKEPKKDSKIH